MSVNSSYLQTFTAQAKQELRTLKIAALHYIKISKHSKKVYELFLNVIKPDIWTITNHHHIDACRETSAGEMQHLKGGVQCVLLVLLLIR